MANDDPVARKTSRIIRKTCCCSRAFTRRVRLRSPRKSDVGMTFPLERSVRDFPVVGCTGKNHANNIVPLIGQLWLDDRPYALFSQQSSLTKTGHFVTRISRPLMPPRLPSDGQPLPEHSLQDLSFSWPC